MNSESNVIWPEEVNNALITLKHALRQVQEANAQIEAARALRIARPQHARQLDLAEQFYIARRKELLDIEDTVATLAGIRKALANLRDCYQAERLTLEGRLLLTENTSGGGDSEASSRLRDEIGSRLIDVSQRYERVAATIQEIREALREYSTIHLQAPVVSSEQ